MEFQKKDLNTLENNKKCSDDEEPFKSSQMSDIPTSNGDEKNGLWTYSMNLPNQETSYNESSATIPENQDEYYRSISIVERMLQSLKTLNSRNNELAVRTLIKQIQPILLISSVNSTDSFYNDLKISMKTDFDNESNSSFQSSLMRLNGSEFSFKLDKYKINDLNLKYSNFKKVLRHKILIGEVGHYLKFINANITLNL